MPVDMITASAISINGRVYVGGGTLIAAEHDDMTDVCYDICKYDPVKDEWSLLPAAPVRLFGVGQLNGKLVIVGGVHEEKGITGDVHVFEEDTQQWITSIPDPPMPTGLVWAKVACHSSAAIVWGMPDESVPSSLFIYNSQSSQWHSRAPPPLPVYSACSSAIIMNDKYYLAPGVKGVYDSETWPSSPAVFSLPLSTLLDPNAPLEPSSWECLPDMPSHAAHLATTGGCLLALGGLKQACDLQNGEEVAANLSPAVYAYCPATSSWVKIGDLPDLRVVPVITTLPSGELFIAGGLSPADEHKKVFTGVIKLI